MKLTGKERFQLWFGAVAVLVGGALQMAEFYVFGTVLMLAGFAIVYPTQRTIVEKVRSTHPIKPLSRTSRTWRAITVGLLLFISIGVGILTTGWPPWESALALVLVAIICGGLVFVGFTIAAKSAERDDRKCD